MIRLIRMCVAMVCVCCVCTSCGISYLIWPTYVGGSNFLSMLFVMDRVCIVYVWWVGGGMSAYAVGYCTPHAHPMYGVSIVGGLVITV
jgi:hypothetical protein